MIGYQILSIIVFAIGLVLFVTALTVYGTSDASTAFMGTSATWIVLTLGLVVMAIATIVLVIGYSYYT